MLLNAAAIVVYGVTDLGIVGVVDKPWGAVDVRGSFHLVFSAIPGIVGAACLVILARRIVSENDERVLLSLKIVFIGGAATLLISFLLNVAIPLLEGYEEFPRLASGVLGLFVPFLYIAMYRYEFLALSAARVAEGLVEEAGYGVVILNREGRVRRMNAAARRLLGLDDHRDPEDQVEELLRSRGPVADEMEKEIVMDEGEGEAQTLLFSQSRIIRREVEIGRLVVINDLTGQKRAEEILRRSRDELEEMAQAKTLELRRAQNMEALSTLAGGFAHDFNNLLAAIHGFATAAMDDMDEGDDTREDAEEILMATREAREIVRQLLDFSRRSPRVDQPVDMWRIVRGVKSLIQVSLPHGVTFDTVQTARHCNVIGDPTKLHQVLMNLCKNAYHSMEKCGGVVRVTVEEELVAGESSIPIAVGSYVKVVVSDTGSGMDEELQGKIFEPFFTTRREQEGTGLGLAMVSRIVEEHGGWITVSSEVGVGSTFALYLPAAKELPASTEVVPARETPEGGSERIMMVDDKEQNLRASKRLLDPLGYDIVTFTEPAAALEEFRGNPSRFDLIITDHLMPDMTGIDLTVNLRLIDARVPIIMISGNLSREVIERGREAGIGAFLDKPLSRNALASAIRSALDLRDF